MNKKNIPKTKIDSTKYIINCAGEKISFSDPTFTSRCAIGNNEDYFEHFGNYVNHEILGWGYPSSISIIIPSYCSEERKFHRTLLSLFSQKYTVSTEILIFINEPKKASRKVKETNDTNEAFVQSLIKRTSKNIPNSSAEIQKLLLTLLSKNKGRIKLRCLRRIVAGGLADIYQIIATSWLARVHSLCDIMPAANRETKIQHIKKSLDNSLILFCDDDMEIDDQTAISDAYHFAVKNTAVISGHLYVNEVRTIKTYKEVLRNVIQLFFDFKHDHNLNILTPRGMLLSHILRAGGVKIGQPFADQLFFAAAAHGQVKYFINASTDIEESFYHGNGKFLKELRLYLEGNENDALDIFNNVLIRYKEENHSGQYCANDIENVILGLKTRNISKILSITEKLLKKQIDCCNQLVK